MQSQELMLLAQRLEQGDEDARRMISRMIESFQDGDGEARDNILRFLYILLRPLAKSHLRREQRSETFKTLDLLHEALIKTRVMKPQAVDWKNISHMRAVAALAMRQIVIDRARRKKRRPTDPLDSSTDLAMENPKGEELVNEALQALERRSLREHQVFVLEYYHDLTHEQVAKELDTSLSTVKRDWEKAKKFLYEYLSKRAKD